MTATPTCRGRAPWDAARAFVMAAVATSMVWSSTAHADNVDDPVANDGPDAVEHTVRGDSAIEPVSAAGPLAVPPPAVAAAARGAAVSKKHTALAAKAATGVARARDRGRWQRQLDRRIGQPPGAVINLYNTWTHEFLPVDAPTAAAVPDVSVAVSDDRVNRFLRCHFTNQPTDMDARLIDALIAAAHHFHARRIDIVSGFRSPKYNQILRKKGREVSRRSQHPRGAAVDFRLPGVPVKRLHAWAKRLRLGGVGLYPRSGFIHVDTGRVRYWQGQ